MSTLNNNNPAAEPAGTGDDTGRRLRVTPLSEIRLKPTRWVWEGRIPQGALTLWAGREGIGKSTSAAWLAAQITKGTLDGAYYGRARAVFYAASEDSWECTVAPRLVAAGADMALTYRIDVIEDEALFAPLTLPLDNVALGKAMKEHDVALLVIDPLVSSLNGKIDTHRDREVRSALEPLGRAADAAGAAVLGLVHFGKSATTDPLTLVLGSRAFTATARAVIAMAKDPEAEDGTVIMSQEKNNLGRLDLPFLTYVVHEAVLQTDDGPSVVGVAKFTGETNRSVGDMLADGGSAEEREDRDEAVAWLMDFLTQNGGEASATDVLKAGRSVGYSADQLKRAKKRAGVRSAKPSFPNAPWVWAFKSGEGSATPATSATGASPSNAPTWEEGEGSEESEGSALMETAPFGEFSEPSVKGAPSKAPLSSLPSVPSLSSQVDEVKEAKATEEAVPMALPSPPPPGGTWCECGGVIFNPSSPLCARCITESADAA